MLKIILGCEGESEFGCYTHNYRQSFHHVNFHPVDGSKSQLIFSGSPCENWSRDSEDAIRTHDAKLRGKNPAAAVLGAKGGAVKSAAKSASSAANGAKGGRPRKTPADPTE